MPNPSSSTPLVSRETEPAPTLTPSSSDGGGDRTFPSNALGRGQTLKKLQTDLPDNEDASESGLRDSDSLDFVLGSDDDDEDLYDAGTYAREGPYSRTRAVADSYTPEEERNIVRTFDRRLTLFMAFLYMLSFLDRSNIGNAKIAGMTDDLRLSSSEYEWVLTAFYITYIVFEWMTLMYRLVPAHIYIPLCTCAWGLFASFQCLVTSFWALLALRALLGFAEAAFSPGIPFYLSFFYKREELAFRTGLVLAAAPLATSFAGSLAWFIVWVSRDGPISPWRALFLFEGFPGVVVAAVAWAFIPDGPGKAWYLTPRERRVAKLRLKSSGGRNRKHLSGGSGFNKREIVRTLMDPKAYLTAFMFFSANVAFSSLPVFLPTIINAMGYSTLTSQALSAPPYLFSFVVVLFIASISDRTRTRSPFIIGLALFSAASYLTIAVVGYFHTYFSSTLHILIRYLCVYPAAAGFFSAITLIITWTMDNQPAKEGKGTGMAILNVIGQCGPLVGTRLYPDSDGPWYVKGMAVCSLFMLLLAGLAFALRVLLKRENERAARAAQRAAQTDGEGGDIGAPEAEGLMGRGTGRSAAAAEEGEKNLANRFVYII